jgi:hypothetical protein
MAGFLCAIIDVQLLLALTVIQPPTASVTEQMYPVKSIDTHPGEQSSPS